MALIGDWPFFGQSRDKCLPPHVQHVLSAGSLRGSVQGPSCSLLQLAHRRGRRSPPAAPPGRGVGRRGPEVSFFVKRFGLPSLPSR